MSAHSHSSPGGHLWLTALDTLDPQLKASLTGIVNNHKGDIVTAVLKEAEKKKKLCLQKRWKVQFRGRTIVLRDLFDKIIAWVNQFAAVVDVAVQYDPGSASLPWAGVRFLLHVAVSDRHCFESTVHGLESVSLLIARYAAFEALYVQKGSSIRAELQRGLSSLYAQILTFLARGVQYFSQPTAIRLVKSVFQTSQNEEIDEIAKSDQEVIKLAQIVDSQVQQQIYVQVDAIRDVVETLQRPVRRLVDASETHAKTLEEERFHDIVKWLSSVPYTQHHNRHSEGRLSSSAQWLFRHPQYVDWKGSSSSSVFLLHGIPGSGKTNLVSAVVDAFLSEHSSNPLSPPMAYFYCGDSRFGRSWADPDEVMRSLTRQFAIVDREKLKIHEQIALEYAHREAEAKLDGFEIPRLQSTHCADLVLSILGANPAVIIVDGVDEIEEARRHELLDTLIRIRDESASVVKIFLSSRDNSNVFATLADASTLRVQENDTRQDMELFVESCLSTAISTRNLLNGSVSDDMRKEVKQFLLDRAGEMFLWVQLQVGRLCKLKSTRSILAALNDPSKSLTTTDNLYSDILENLVQTDSLAYATAVKAFSWLLCMREPLSSTTFIDAVSSGSPDAHHLDLSELLSICSNLIVHDKQLDTLRFAHISFKEFLETKPEFDSPSAHTIATLGCIETCIHHLPINVEGELHPERDYSLYAVLYWAQHYAAATVANEDQVIGKLREFIFGDDGFAFQLWLEAADKASEILPSNNPLKKELNAVMSDSQTPFFTACIYGLKDVFDTAVQDLDFDVDATNSLGHTGLYLAAAFGRHHLVELTLDLGANPGISHGKFGDPLSAACAGGHISVVQFLLSHESHSSPATIEPALRLSFLTGHEEISRLLLKSYLHSLGGQPEVNRNDIDWLLEAAARAGFTEAMEELTKGSPATPLPKLNPSKIVNAAIRKGRIDFMRKYMEKEALPADVVATAALFGQTEIIHLCLDKGHDMEKEGPFGTPLRSASLMGHENAVRALLSRGANVNTVSPLGDALQVAAMKGHLSITNVLIQNHANVDNSGGFFGNALQAAAYRGHRDVVEALLAAGASINMKGRYKDAFHAAAEAGQEGIINLFLDKGYSFPGERGPFLASIRPPSPTKDLLRQASPSVFKPAHDYFEEHEGHAVDSGSPEAIAADFEGVLNHTGDAPVSSSNMAQAVYQVRRSRSLAFGQYLEDECYALEVAASRGHLKIVRWMIAARKKLRIEDFHLGQALWAACTNGYTEIAKAITAVEVDLRSFIMESLERAARRGHAEIVDILIQYEEKWGPPSRSWLEAARVSWRHSDPEENTFCEKRLFDDSFECPYTLPLVLAGCRGGQLSSVLRGFQLAGQSETERLYKLALKEAVRFDKTDIIGFVLGNDVSCSPELLAEAMRTAAQHGSKSALALLLGRDYTKDVLDDVYISCFTEAVSNGQTEIFQYLMSQDAGVYPPELFGKAFVHAAHEGHCLIMTSLAQEIQYHESCPTTFAQALNAACAAGTVDSVEWLINAGVRIDAVVDDIPKLVAKVEKPSLRRLRHRNRPQCHENRPRSALEACLQPFLEPGKLHLDGEGNTEAARVRQEPVLKLLLEHGADVNQTIGGKTSPLHVAALNCSEEIVRVLIAKGADVNADIPNEGTPLQSAAKRELESLSIMRLLLESGAVIGSQDDMQQQQNPVLNEALSFFGPPPSSPRTQLRLGSDARWPECGRFFESESVQDVLSTGPGAVIKLLLLSQPDLHATDKRFSLLLQMLASAGDIEFMQLLIDRGVDVNLCGHYYGCALQAAARFGHLECIQLLLNADAQVNLVDGTYGTPLQAAIIGGHQEIATALIAHGADVNLYSKNSSGRETNASTPPLQLAIQSKQLLLTMQLLDAGAKLGEGMPALHLAIEAADFDAAERLLAAGADMNAGDWERSPVLITACQNGDIRMIEFLLSRGADVNVDGTKRYRDWLSVEQNGASPLHAACSQGYYGIVRMLLNQGAHLEKRVEDSVTPLGLAASIGDLKMMGLLLEFGARIYDPSADLNVLKQATDTSEARETLEFLLQRLSNTPELVAACEEALPGALRRCDEKLSLVLLDQVPKTPSLLGQACRLGSQDVVRHLLSHGVGVDSDLENGERALHIAAYHQRVDLVAFLIQEGADVQYVSSKHGAPVSAALEGLLASTYHPELPSEIVPENISFDHGGWISESESDTDEEEEESSPMGRIQARNRFVSTGEGKHGACEKMIDVLLRAGAEVNPAVTVFGAPLHVASYMGELSTINFLLERGADINAAGGYYGSALIAAMASDQEEAFSLLLERGINVNIRSKKLGTALHYACRHKDRLTVQVLLKHGADPNASGSEFESPIAALLSRDLFESQEKIREILDLLLQCGDRLQVREADLCAAAKLASYCLGEGIFEALCQHNRDLPVSQALIAAVASVDWYDSANHLKSLLERADDVEISTEIFKSVRRPEVLELLLQHQPRCAITPDIFEALADVRSYGHSLVKTLLDQEPQAAPTSSVIVSVLRNSERFRFSDEDDVDLLRRLLDRNPDTQISESMLLASQHPQFLQFLLSRAPEFPIRNELVESVVSRAYIGSKLLKVILNHDKSLQIDQGSLNACLEKGTTDCLELILENNPELTLPLELILKKLKSIRKYEKGTAFEMLEVLARLGKRQEFTPEIHRAVKEQFQLQSESDMKQLFLSLEKPD